MLTARSVTGARTEYDIRELRLARGPAEGDGELVAITQRRRGLGVRDMRLQLARSRPRRGRVLPRHAAVLRHAVRLGVGSGFLDDLDVRLDWAFADARVPGNPVSTIAGEGGVGARREQGLVFTAFEVRSSDMDLRTVRLIAPAVILEGRLAATARSTGRCATSTSTAPPAIATATGRPACSWAWCTSTPGSIPWDSPPTSPSIRSRSRASAARSLRSSQGELRGRFRSEGTLARLAVDADPRARSAAPGRGVRHAAAAPLGRREPAAPLLPARPRRADRAELTTSLNGRAAGHRQHRHAARAGG